MLPREFRSTPLSQIQLQKMESGNCASMSRRRPQSKWGRGGGCTSLIVDPPEKELLPEKLIQILQKSQYNLIGLFDKPVHI
jgi:hypothetical protein